MLPRGRKRRRDNAGVISKPMWYVGAPYCWGAEGKWRDVAAVRSHMLWEHELGGRAASLMLGFDVWNRSAFSGLDRRGQGALF